MNLIASLPTFLNTFDIDEFLLDPNDTLEFCPISGSGSAEKGSVVEAARSRSLVKKYTSLNSRTTGKS